MGSSPSAVCWAGLLLIPKSPWNAAKIGARILWRDRWVSHATLYNTYSIIFYGIADGTNRMPHVILCVSRGGQRAFGLVDYVEYLFVSVNIQSAITQAHTHARACTRTRTHARARTHTQTKPKSRQRFQQPNDINWEGLGIGYHLPHSVGSPCNSVKPFPTHPPLLSPLCSSTLRSSSFAESSAPAC